MEWTVVTVIVVLVGLFFTVGKPILNNQKEMNQLRFETDQQGSEINDNLQSLKELSKIAQSHENRLQLAENAIEKLTLSISEWTESRHNYDERIHNLERDIKSLRKKE